MYFCYMNSPVGRLLLAGDEEVLKLISFKTGRHVRQPDADWRQDEAPLRETMRQLGEYFAGERRDFDLPLQPVGTTFQQSVWQALRAIPYGETESYGALAKRIGKPKAVRAVGASNGVNPLPIVLPCHRVIGANGSLTGYGGGLEVKQKLLALERGERALL
ncbi:MAG TPA: methylated-DNA--[protein]-cysteine S-methyltransferase [Gammaproteobacteria bacterium]|nr:methylated-DNA--[protein]-cysteine S-methyltransferase [Gammaproteobacteria bacterium]